MPELPTLHPDFNGTLKIDVPITMAGAFAFYTTYTPLPEFSTSNKPSPTPTRTATYYIDVSPKLSLGNEVIPLDALSIFSVVSRFMGEFPKSWDKHLEGVARREYNMVHFTPLVERGVSRSPYSLYDQCRFDPEYFTNGEKDIASMIQKMEQEQGLLGMTDVVWNHTANNSKWLEEHPEAGYNIETAPWMESAIELDTALLKFGEDLGTYNLPTDLKTAGDLSKVIAGMHEEVINKLDLWQYFVIDVDQGVRDALAAWPEATVPEGTLNGVQGWSLEQKANYLLSANFVGAEGLGPRYHRKADAKSAAGLLAAIYGPFSSMPSDQGAAAGALRDILDAINVEFYKQYDSDMAVVSQQVFDRVRYLRLDDDGPKMGPINRSSPLIESYFTRLPENSTTQKHGSKSLALANNGWIWAANALKDHAGSDSRAYLRREVIVWSDCVKLRYGNSPADNPFLWDFMTKYTRLMAKYFAGFRIDNCHSTPIHAAEYLLDEARAVRPNLAVFAELFTGSEEMDYVFVKRLGISSLIREAMQAWSTQELSRLVHMHAGRPIGSFDVEEVSHNEASPPSKSGTNGVNGAAKAQPEKVQLIQGSPIHALFMDCTHDNEMPTQKRDARDTLPTTALVNMCASATGSVMGFDEIYPRAVNIVSDKRLYTSSSSDGEVTVGAGSGGIGGIKKLLNRLHTMMGKEGYDETFIDHQEEYITIHRVHPMTRKGYFLAAHTAYPGCGAGHGNLPPVHLAGTEAKLVGCWKLEVDTSDEAKKACAEDQKYLKGLPAKVVGLDGVGIDLAKHETVLTMPASFPPGSIALFETWIPSTEHVEGLDKLVTSGATEAFSTLDLLDLNFMLYRCEAEERDSSSGNEGVYTIPGHGPLVYAGLQGWWSVLKFVIKDNDLGHPICSHLREGRWAFDHIIDRLQRIAKRDKRPNLIDPTEWLIARFQALRTVPSFLLPRYFALVIKTAYYASWDRAMALLSDNVQHGQKFLQSLAMTSIQMSGTVKSASLVPNETVPSLAAGLPHFTTSWARAWGRDIFIALRGLYLGIGRYDDAKMHIKAFASVLKHGMVPNLLSDGRAPRYNARDAIWFFLQNIQDYTNMAPDGMKIMKDYVHRRFLPFDDTYFSVEDSRAYQAESTIEDIIQEAMQRHATGISFREANAGIGLDMQMRSEGFNIRIKPDWTTGLIFGGNQYNCGTWMDKMGESERAGSKGIPGTPRDGAAIELTGLLYSTLTWLSGLYDKGKYRYSHVKKADGTTISFAEWAKLIKANFERCYYIPRDPADDSKYDVNPSIINRRGIYKDLYRSGKEYEDYQLRANFPIAMTVAPSLFDPAHAMSCIELADKVIRGPTGMATLDPSDLNYHSYYINSEDSDNFATSKGRNYHQGPEWIWPTGYFLRAMLKFDLMRRRGEDGKVSAEQRTEAFQQVTRRLEGCKKAIEESPWAGLAELTNKGGELCRDSSPTQAWSSGCLIDLFYDASELSQEEDA
ncbi:MAG: bifunctional 4-alpha-glucanotransferase/amylo-alpha-1,6-glucosidase [Ramalina farinacea]|uniref:Glycogen debranching enzyme n=1 Tax=Ramalina farinacea TaxID=258253 RepID=A0AA43QY44_9LECA|nr:bifunctional 4-alpha-glucanotransferase/amylo-alpha-1,6-glucosidase [Ramalina farinacea]